METTHRLIERSLVDDQEAGFLLFEPHRARLLLLIRRLGARVLGADFDTEDVLQEVLGTAWRLLPDYEHRGPGFFYRWLVELARNEVNDRAKYVGAKGRNRVRHLESRSDPDALRPPFDAARSITSIVAARDEAAWLRRVMEQLEPGLREVFELHYLEDRSWRDIARTSGVPLTTIYARTQQAYARVRQLRERGG